ncbi:MAG: DUF374 domain-containing protein [Rickettsiales bacterium]|nr:MAG: DUF374 domain-containing protein [Rickettsiales bacterium]
MIKRIFKRYLRHNIIFHWFIVYSISVYLKLVYLTSRWKIIWLDENMQHNINQLDGVLFALWHNRLAFGMHIFKKYDNVMALASSHTDGKLITDIIKTMNYDVIEGSTNRNPMGAVRSIIKAISTKGKVVITPDGPRGPVYKVNSSITKIAFKYNKSLIPISCSTTDYFELKSWDRMIMPKLFGKVIVIFGKSIELSGNQEQDDKALEEQLKDLSDQATTMTKKGVE